MKISLLFGHASCIWSLRKSAVSFSFD
jgi:hypothetical protein